MPRSIHNPWLNRFACLTALVTFALVGLGGLVTSHEAGMAVPDWPTTYGYNMFLFPVSQWIGGIFYEHTHRLLASALGFLTIILTVWLWLAESRRWLRWLGVIALFAVVLQGVLGGLRVVLFKAQIGIFHAALAQSFLALLCLIAMFTGRFWTELAGRLPRLNDERKLRTLLPFATLLIFSQLVLGATMRHQHAGLAIPDFPLAYHKLWPAMDSDSVANYNAHRVELDSVNPITGAQIALQMAHRILAVLIFGFVVWSMLTTRRQLGAIHPLARLSLLWFVLILAQIALGAFTIWSNKAADVATAHVMIGASCLGLGVLLTAIAFRVLIPIRVSVNTAARSAPDIGVVKRTA